MEDKLDQDLELHRLQTLLDAARLLNSTLDLKEVTQIILDVVRAEIPVERMSVFVVDRARNTLRSLVAQGVEDFEISLPIGAGVAGAVASTGEVLDIPDAYSDPRFESRFDQKLQFHTKDLFALPVYNRQGDIVGVLQLLNRLRPITHDDREFLLGISVYIGLALQNAWSHSQGREQDRFKEELVTLRDRLAEAEQLSLTSELLQQVLHEIANPLSIAIGYTELARNINPLQDNVRSYLEKIAHGLDRTATAARRFRQFTQHHKHQQAPLSLGDVLRQISDLRAQEWSQRNIEASLFLQTAPAVLANERQIQLVILNLLKTAEQGLLQLADRRELRMELSASGRDVRIEIYDSGPTRMFQVQPRLSESPFASEAEGSASLDFAVVSSIVEQHKGRVLAKDDHHGNCVVIELPAYHNDGH
jgi:signal transduction histidine kinase